MKTDLITQFKLPSYLKGKSFADASKAIEGKFKDREDKASNETKQDLLERLSQAQEYIKMQEDVSNKASNKLADGGFANTQFGAGFQEGADADAVGGSITAGLGMLTTGVDLANTAFGDTGIDTSGASGVAGDIQSTGGAMFGSAMKGASAGAALGPIGAGVGAVLGAGAGLIGNGRAKKDAIKADKNNDLKLSNQYKPNDYAFGGEINPHRRRVDPVNQEAESGREETAWTDKRDAYYKDAYNTWKQQKTGVSPNHKLSQSDPVYIKFWEDTKANWANNNPRPNNKTMANKVDSNNIFTTNYAKGGPIYGVRKPVEFDDGNNGVQRAEDLYNFAKNGIDNLENPDTIPKPKTGVGNFLDKAGTAINNHGAEALRYAPIVGNLFNKIDKPTTDRPTKLDSVYKPQLFDEERLLNQVNQNNVNKGLTESSGGDAGALRTNLLAAHLNKNKAKSDAYFKGNEVNRSELTKQFESGRQKDMFNAQQDERYIDRKARDEGAYNTAKSAKRSALFEDIGKIGKEQSFRKTVKEMYGYRPNGTYIKQEDGSYKDENGKVISKQAYELGEQAKAKQKNKTN